MSETEFRYENFSEAIETRHQPEHELESVSSDPVHFQSERITPEAHSEYTF